MRGLEQATSTSTPAARARLLTSRLHLARVAVLLLAALAAMGVVHLWKCYLQRGWRAVLLPTTLCLTAAWEVYIESSALGWKLDGSQSLMAVLSATRAQSGDP